MRLCRELPLQNSDDTYYVTVVVVVVVIAAGLVVVVAVQKFKNGNEKGKDLSSVVTFSL